MNVAPKAEPRYIIALKPLKKKARFKEEMIYDFETKNPKPKFDNLMYLPNMDFKSPNWMSAFQTPYERYHLEKNSAIYQDNFKKRLERGKEEELKLLLQPRPPKATTCAICSVNFEDFYTHVISPNHKENFTKSFSMQEALDEIMQVQANFYRPKLNTLEKVIQADPIIPTCEMKLSQEIENARYQKSFSYDKINESKAKATQKKVRRMTIINSSWNPYFPSSAPHDQSSQKQIKKKSSQEEDENNILQTSKDTIKDYKKKYPSNLLSPKPDKTMIPCQVKDSKSSQKMTSKSKSKIKKTDSQRNLGPEYQITTTYKCIKITEVYVPNPEKPKQPDIKDNPAAQGSWDFFKSKVNEWVSDFKHKITELVKY